MPEDERDEAQNALTRQISLRLNGSIDAAAAFWSAREGRPEADVLRRLILLGHERALAQGHT